MTLSPEQHSSSAGGGFSEQVQGVYCTVAADGFADLLTTVESWFADRIDVALVDSGTTDKLNLSYFMLEWIEREVDPLFLAILREDERIEDYTLYVREVN